MLHVADICKRLDTSEAQLRQLTRATYTRLEVKKPRGGVRVVWSPCIYLRAVQTPLLQVFHETLRVHDAATGFVRGRGPYFNAARHVGAKVLLQTDVVGFYEAITAAQVAAALQATGYGATAAYLLAEVCTRQEGDRRVLVQGAATSSVLANAVCYALDETLAPFEDSTYTRYADDITMSWREVTPERAAEVRDCVEAVLRHYGFVPNERKTRFVCRNEPMLVTGLLINPAPGRPPVRAPRSVWRRLRAGTNKNADGRTTTAAAREKLRQAMCGLASFLRQSDAERARPFSEVLR